MNLVRYPSRYMTFLTLSIASAVCLVYFFSLSFAYFSGDISFLVLLGSLPYTIYMFIYELKLKRRENVSEGLISTENKIFMIDTYSRFLFSFTFGVFLHIIINLLMTNFTIPVYDGLLGYFVLAYICLVLPVAVFVDLFTTNRRKHPEPTKDLIIIFLLCASQCGYRIAIWLLIIKFDMAIICPFVAYSIIFFLATVIGYILFDFTLFKKSDSSEYVMFKNESIIVDQN